ncbi:MAG: hypothetical protein K2K56_07920 [Lachnospiraceae bacterium]|nr:hypothetical protein [Lachnospiraceae bacterium]
MEKNRGSTIIEMTLLISVFMGVIFFYITFFLFLINSAGQMEQTAEYLYCANEERSHTGKPVNMQIQKQGDIETAWFEETDSRFLVYVKYKRWVKNPVENIRRWQLAVDLVSQGGNETLHDSGQ